MKKGIVLLGLSMIICCSQLLMASGSAPSIQKMNQMPLAFTKNMGQWDSQVLFRANSGGATMWLTKEGVTYQFTRRIDKSGKDPVAALDSRLVENYMERDSVEQLVLTAKFVGANPNPEIIAEDQLEYKCNYFLGNDPTKWHTDVPNYEAITLKDIYPGIDLRYSGDGNRQAAYEFVVAPGADIARIEVEYEGAEETSIDADGRMIVTTKWGEMIEAMKSPANGVLSATSSFFQLSEKTIGLEAHGSSQQQLDTFAVALIYSTYLGGAVTDGGYGIAVDGSGNAYVTGQTYSSNFPMQNPYQTNQGSRDVYITKFSSSGDNLIYSTYLGGGGEDWGYDIAIDGSGDAYVTGFTYSSDFPTQNPYQLYQGPISCYDVFVTKLSSSGDTLIYSTYLGGGDLELGTGIAVDGSGAAYVTGWTLSSDFPTQNPYQMDQGGRDAFVAKLSSSGSSLFYSTYLGGGDWDEGFAIAVDRDGHAQVTGFTGGSDFPTQNPYQTYRGSGDVFVTKLSSSGNTLIYSTYLGGGSYDLGTGIAIDGSGNVYVTGRTLSSDFPTQNPYQMDEDSYDVFVAKLSSSGDSLIYSTYLGGGDFDSGDDIAVDDKDNAYVTGWTSSYDFPTQRSYQTDQGSRDVFVTKLSDSGNSLTYSTYLGGGGDEYGNAIAVDDNGGAYVTGSTFSSDFPTQRPYQAVQGQEGAFVTKLRTYICGDANGSGTVNISDAVYLIAYIFAGGQQPNPMLAGDANCDLAVNISDAVYLIAYIFSGGAAPCDACK